MTVDKDTVARVAKLARLAVPEDRLGALADEINGILKWVEQLGEVDVAGVDPMTSAVAMKLKMREDVVSEGPTGGGQPDKIVANAPKTDAHFFVVPKVVE
jgi:aspartyl-tRNA(Asn)/glutamyl-tRNA(Gln) amidotransferase subunit C